MLSHSRSRFPILIVEDDPEVLRALAFSLEARGYAAETCDCGRDALAMAPGRRYSCLIIDQMLTDGQGIDLLEALRRSGVAAPAILITTAPSVTLRRRAVAAAAPIVEKPLLDETLFQHIRRLVQTDR